MEKNFVMKTIGMAYLSNSKNGIIMEIDGIPEKIHVSVSRMFALLNKKTDLIDLKGEWVWQE